MKKVFISITAGLIATLSIAGASYAANRPASIQTATNVQSQRQAGQRPKITGSVALATLVNPNQQVVSQLVTAKYPGATVKKIKLKVKKGILVYKVHAKDAQGKQLHVWVTTGSSPQVLLKKDGQKNGVPSGIQLASLAKIQPSTAQQKAQAVAPYTTVKKVKLTSKNGYLVYVVKLQSSTQKYKVFVDAGSGAVLYKHMGKVDAHHESGKAHKGNIKKGA